MDRDAAARRKANETNKKKKVLERKENGGVTFRKACHDEDDREMRGVMKPNVRDLADDEKE